MSNPPVVLDTNAFRDGDFVWWLKQYRGEKVVPVVVYCELAVHFIAKSGDTAKLDGMLYGAGVSVSQMDREHARRAAELAQGRDDWHDHWRDLMIASYATIDPRYLITENIRDFEVLGDRAVRPRDFKNGINDGSLR